MTALRVIITTLPLVFGDDCVVLNVVERSIARGRFKLRFGKSVSFRIFSTIMARHAAGQFLGMNELVHLVYGDDPQGGPINAGNNIRVLVCRRRFDLARLGLCINANWSAGKSGRAVVDLWAVEALAGAA